MSGTQLLLVAGTHGNEINAPWLLDQWGKNPDLIKARGIGVAKVVGNPAALKVCRRYLDRDLNRCFSSELLNAPTVLDHEVVRARNLLARYGSKGEIPCQIAIDLHSTTSSMGTSLVVYGRRPADLAFASLIQARLGLPVYLHEGDAAQDGFLVESWPCGFVIEIGPVPQGSLQAKIVQQTRLVLEACLEVISRVKAGLDEYPPQLVVHRHLRSLDFPRDVNGIIQACVHPDLQGKDWIPLRLGDPLFLRPDGKVIEFNGDVVVPVFINEAAYVEKRIAMSLTQRELWIVANAWKAALTKVIRC